MYHYTYIIEFTDGMRYVGVHSTHIQPELDATYLGSGRKLPKRDRHTCTKTVLSSYATRAQALKAEKEFIESNDCVNSSKWYNVRNWNYDKHGQTKDTCENIASMASKLAGRTKDTHEYIRLATEKRKQYVGDNRTPAQIEGSKRTAEKVRGTKCPEKGHHGTDNQAFVPWYYITASGELVKVLNETKRSYAVKIGLTPRQLAHRFHHTNINKPAKQGVCKGWIFGNLSDLNGLNLTN